MFVKLKLNSPDARSIQNCSVILLSRARTLVGREHEEWDQRQPEVEEQDAKKRGTSLKESYCLGSRGPGLLMQAREEEVGMGRFFGKQETA